MLAGTPANQLFSSPQSKILTPRAFSLMEFMLVLALIGLLAGVVTISTRSIMTRGKQNAARGEIATIVAALDAYYQAFGRYPTSQEGLSVLTQKSEKFTEPLLSHAPVDPWSHPYVYISPGRGGQAYEVICLGADGREGGEGADADITSANLGEKPAKAAP